ncbi:MAG: hypothetical protein R3F61_17435 [Myxococcota bacterium]
MLVWLAFPALADPGDGFEPLREAADCVYTQRPKEHAEGSAMRAVCTWADVDPAVLDEKLGDFAAYDEHIWVVDESEVRRTVGERSLVYQLQQIWGISDREVLLWAWTEPVDGGHRHRWETATDEPLEPRKGAIRTPKNEGYWEVRANPDGPGALVTHEIAVDAGGVPLPGWLLQWIRTRGFARVMDDIRSGSVIVPASPRDSAVPVR